jgi:hypothetical protein
LTWSNSPDNAPPTITCAGPVTINTTAGLCTGTTTLTAPTVSDYCPANALSFDGSNDWVSTPVTLGSNPTATIEAWLYPISTTDNMRIISNTSGGPLGLTIRFEGGKLQLWSVCGSWQDLSNTVIPVNQWTHIAVVINGSQVTGFINGVQELTITCSTYIQDLGMGDNYFGYGTYYNGKMDEVRFWNVVRTPAQIAANMNIQINAQAGLIGLYHLNEGLAGGNNAGITTATDNSGSSNHGTLNNFALSGATSNWVTGLPFISLSNNAPSTYPKGNTIVTWTATDACGNSATCQQMVTVTDNQVPTLTNPGNQAMNVIGNTCAANYTIADPVSDNCTGSTWGYTLTGATAATVTGIPDGTSSGVLSFNQGITTVVLSATDGTNSAATVSFTVTVQDNTDTDGDGTTDCNDGCPNDPNKTAPGICGCGVADTDTDGDGTANCNDGCPNDPNKIAPGICGCGVADTDTDGDGTADCNDGCPNDPNKTAPVISTNSNCQGTIQDYTALGMVSGTGCATGTVVQTPPQGTIFNPGTVGIKLTVTDSNSGETATCIFNVTVSGGCGN